MIDPIVSSLDKIYCMLKIKSHLIEQHSIPRFFEFLVACTHLHTLLFSSIFPSVFPSIGRSVCLSVCPSIHPSVHLSVHLNFCQFVPLSDCLSVRPFISPSVHPTICPSVRLSVCPSIHPSITFLKFWALLGL